MIFGYQLLSAAVTQLLDFMVWERAADRYPDPSDLARFLGIFGAVINIVSVAFVALLAGRLLTWDCAWLVDQGQDNNMEVAVAKLFTADNAMRITTDAVQVFAGYGYSREYPVEKLMRDVKVCQIYEGTSQVQRIVIGRKILRDAAKKLGVDPREIR